MWARVMRVWHVSLRGALSDSHCPFRTPAPCAPGETNVGQRSRAHRPGASLNVSFPHTPNSLRRSVRIVQFNSSGSDVVLAAAQLDRLTDSLTSRLLSLCRAELCYGTERPCQAVVP